MEKSCSILLDTSSFADLKSYMLFDEKESIKVLPNFNTINIFVGSNNSGKSRFMRTLMKQQKLKGINSLKDILSNAYRHNEIVKKLEIKWRRNNRNYYPNPPSIVSNTGSLHVYPVEFNDSQYFSEKDSIITSFKNQIHHLELTETLLKDDLFKYYEDSITFNDINIPENFESDLREAIVLARYIVDNYEVQDLGTRLNYYIPILRTAHSLFEKKEGVQIEFTKLKRDVFLDTLLKSYDFESYISYNSIMQDDGGNKEIKKIYIFTGLNLYNQIVNARNGSKTGRKHFEKFERFVGKEFFNTESIDIVAQFNIHEKHQNKDDNEIINISLEGREGKHLYDLGDGIQSLIILMYSIFMASDNTIIYIDEPELNLHPGMQRLFLDQITGNKDLTKKNLTYVIATHSNHLLDLTIEKNNISIYSFSKSKDDKFTIKNVNVGDNELLRELGVDNSSVFLANCSIWVEGISDRNYIKAFLIAYCDKDPDKKFPKEDIDFAFLEYAGSNLSHYDFSKEKSESIKAFALNNRIFILADNDENKEEKHKSYEELSKLNPQNLEYSSTFPFREIENLLSDEIWENVLINLCNKKKTKTQSAKIQSSIKSKVEKTKAENFKVAYIGEYLKTLEIEELNDVYDLLDDHPKSLKSSYKTYLSAIILDKTINKELTWELFSKNNKVVELTENIYNFITRK